MIIETNFDNPLEEDIVFEEVDNQQELEDTLKSSENILKAFLYLKKLMDESSPFINKIIHVETIDTTQEKSLYIINEDTGKILIKNIDPNSQHSIFINDGEFVLFPYESIEIPADYTTKLETNGLFSIIESEYKLGKG